MILLDLQLYDRVEVARCRSGSPEVMDAGGSGGRLTFPLRMVLIDRPLVWQEFKEVEKRAEDGTTQMVEVVASSKQVRWVDVLMCETDYTCADLLRLVKHLGSSLGPGDPFLAFVWAAREWSVNGSRDVVAVRTR